MQTLFHKNWMKKIKEQTGANHVCHIANVHRDGKKINCVWIKNGDKELKYGGEKSFSEFSPSDYEAAIKEFNTI